MRKLVLTSLVLAIVGGFILNSGTQHVMAAEDNSKYGGVLKWNIANYADVIGDPLIIRKWNHGYIDCMLQTLIVASNDKDNRGTLVPELATSWELSPDKTHYIFKLRKGVKFHDGTDFNAQAVKWNLDRWLNSSRPNFDKVTSLEVIDDHTLKCNLSSWDAITLQDFSMQSFMISPTAFEKNGHNWIKYNPVGTGAFSLVEHKRNVRILYDKFEDYWEKDLPYLDGIHITMIKDPMTAMASLKRGDIDGWYGLDSVSAAQLKATGDFVIDVTPGTNEVISFNSKDPSSVLSDKRVRMAIEYAIDKEAIAKATGRGFKKPIYQVIHSIPDGAGTVPRKYDPEKAKQLLKEAGIPNGTKIKYTYQALPKFQDVVVAIQQYMAEVGITIVPNALSPATFSQKTTEPPMPNEIIFENQRGGSISPDGLLAAAKQSLGSGSVYFAGINKPEEFNTLLAKSMDTVNLDEIMSNLYEMEKIGYEDAMFIPLYSQMFSAVQHPYVKGAVWHWGGLPFPKFHHTWLDK